jgi:2'-5' RNA ligase
MAECALVVPFPGLVEQVGIANDLPPHITVLYPSPADDSAIGDVLARFAAFDVTFPRAERFPEQGVLWLAPEPAEPFARMTKAMVDRFPDHLPYGGIHDEIVPHLSVALAQLDETVARLEPLLPLRSRAECVVLYQNAGDDHWRELHTFGL